MENLNDVWEFVHIHFFWHLIINKEGWLIGNGGLDFPHACEKLEAYARIMIKKNLIIDELIEEIFKIKSMQTLGHFLLNPRMVLML